MSKKVFLAINVEEELMNEKIIIPYFHKVAEYLVSLKKTDGFVIQKKLFQFRCVFFETLLEVLETK